MKLISALFRCLVLVLYVLLTGCEGLTNDANPIEGDGRDTEIPTASFESMRLNPAFWTSAMDELQAQGMQVDQIALMVDGKLLATRHFNNYTSTTLHDMRSATKSVTSLLLGIAIDRGMISSLDSSVNSYFPELVPHPSRTSYRALSLRDLASMRTGLDCDDWRNSQGNEELMYRSPNWVNFFYTVPALQAPGEAFSYCTAAVVVLGEVIARAARQSLPAFARSVLFDPLGIQNARWADAGANITDAGGHLHISLAAILKIGELMRNGGMWQGKRVVSEAWVAQSIISTGEILEREPSLKAHWGQLWWLEPVVDGVAKSYQARGNGGQLIIVVPEVKLVMAVTGYAYNQSPQV
jgi:CubicO group peptidase (beta-lactamase class C family)